MGASPSVSPSRPSQQGLVQVFTGDGRGKTSAALGTVLRALGNGLRVYVVAFMKPAPSGEWHLLDRLENVTVERFGSQGFVDPEHLTAGDREQAARAFAAARQAVMSGNYNLVVLDEVNLAVAWGLVDRHDLLSLMREKPPGVELILTGRKADKEIIRAADLVTEMLNIKHPYGGGTPARRGIEY